MLKTKTGTGGWQLLEKGLRKKVSLISAGQENSGKSYSNKRSGQILVSKSTLLLEFRGASRNHKRLALFFALAVLDEQLINFLKMFII